MSLFTLSVAGHTYYLPADTDVVQLQDRLVDAVRHGGDVVAIPTVGTTECAVLVSPGLPVYFEERPDAPAQPEASSWTRSMFTAEEWDSY
ncbi:hypothetical protein [Planctomonas deserti]|jgi:hypothetical protein|uniref:hypothetical protein n=1 Tax=Planctomonas deserti TaxID=2144185 RepID=UPI000D3D9E47|nr:hypothetical protein [Planctomonas deserti]